MSEEKIELLDDFLVDMDIETITLDNIENKDFLEVEEMDEEVSEVKPSQSVGGFGGGVQIENLNLNSQDTSTPDNIEISAQNINLYQQGPTNIDSPITQSQPSSTPQVQPSPFNVQQPQPQQTIGLEQPQVQIKSSAGVAPTEIKLDNVTFEIKEAEIKVDKSNIVSSKPLETKTESPSVSIPEESDDEIIKISETDLDDVMEKNIVELDNLGSQTEKEFELEEISPSNVDFEATIEELEKVEEPSPEVEEFATEDKNLQQEEKIEYPTSMEEEDSIVSIDGSELDNLIYGESGLSQYIEEPQEPQSKEEIFSEESFESQTPFAVENFEPETPITKESDIQAIETTIPESHKEKSPLDEEIGIDNIEEIKFEEIPIEEVGFESEEIPEENIPPIEEAKEEKFSIPVIDKEAVESEVVIPEPAEISNENLISPNEVSIKDETENFNFDISVIPDVAEVEEDEPIALSLEELNNIEVSEEAVDYSTEQPPEITFSDEENVEIPLEEFSHAESEDLIKEPASLDVYGLPERESEEIQFKDVENIFEEPGIAGVLSESGGIEKIDSMSTETKEELKTVLKYLDSLLEDLPEDKIKEFAKSEYYDLYIKILDKLGV